MRPRPGSFVPMGSGLRMTVGCVAGMTVAEDWLPRAFRAVRFARAG